MIMSVPRWWAVAKVALEARTVAINGHSKVVCVRLAVAVVARE